MCVGVGVGVGVGVRVRVRVGVGVCVRACARVWVAFEGVRPGVEVALVKKATCSWVELHKDAHFIVQGSRGSELLSYDNVRSVSPLRPMFSGPRTYLVVNI